jgi:hypothetical protein
VAHPAAVPFGTKKIWEKPDGLSQIEMLFARSEQLVSYFFFAAGFLATAFGAAFFGAAFFATGFFTAAFFAGAAFLTGAFLAGAFLAGAFFLTGIRYPPFPFATAKSCENHVNN